MSKKPFYIHVGYGKTATTWFQDCLFSRCEGIEYFGKKKGDYPSWLIELHYADDGLFDGRLPFIREMILARHEASDRVSLVSSEAFTNLESVFSQAKRIRDTFPNPRILVTLRDPLAWIESFYNQNLKTGTFFLELDSYLDFTRTPRALQKRKPIYLPGLRFDDVIAYYQSLFGVSNVFISQYEDFCADPQTYVDRMGVFMGVQFPAIGELVKVKLNEGIDSGRTRLNKVRNLVAYLAKFRLRGRRMPPALRSELAAYFKESCSMYPEGDGDR